MNDFGEKEINEQRAKMDKLIEAMFDSAASNGIRPSVGISCMLDALVAMLVSASSSKSAHEKACIHVLEQMKMSMLSSIENYDEAKSLMNGNYQAKKMLEDLLASRRK